MDFRQRQNTKCNEVVLIVTELIASMWPCYKLRSVCFCCNYKLLCAPHVRYSLAYVIGSTILHIFSFKEHAASDMHRMLIRSVQRMKKLHTLSACWEKKHDIDASWFARMIKPVPYRCKCTSVMIATCFPVGFNVCSIYIMLGQFNSRICTNLL